MIEEYCTICGKKKTHYITKEGYDGFTGEEIKGEMYRCDKCWNTYGYGTSRISVILWCIFMVLWFAGVFWYCSVFGK